MRNKFVYSWSIRIHASGFDELLESIFCILPVVEAFSCKKLLRCLKKWLSVGEKSGEMADEATLRSPVHLNFQVLVVQSGVGVVMEKNWVHSVDQSWLQALRFLVNLIDLLSILLRCNGFAGIQKAVVDQVGSRLPNTDHNFFFFFWWKFGFGKCFGVQPLSCYCQLPYKIHSSEHITIWLRNGGVT